MRWHLSVLWLMVRSTLYKVIGLLALMVLVEGSVFCLLAGDAVRLELAVTDSRIAVVFAVFFLLLTVLLISFGCAFSSKTGYTLQRLSVSEQTVFLWQALYNTLCFLLLWGVQIIAVLALAHWYYDQADPAMVSGQSLFLAFSRNDFLHCLLPLEESGIWVRNGVMAAGMGMAAAAGSFGQRRGHKFAAAAMVAAFICLNFRQNLGTPVYNIVTAGVVVIAGFIFYAVQKRLREERCEDPLLSRHVSSLQKKEEGYEA